MLNVIWIGGLVVFLSATIFTAGYAIGQIRERKGWNNLIAQGILPNPKQASEIVRTIPHPVA